MNFAGNLKFLRKKAGKTQDALSSEVNIGRTTIANYEASISEPNLETLHTFANYFGVTMDELLSKNLTAEAKSNDKDLMLRAAYSRKNQAFSGVPRVIAVDNSGNDNIIYVPVKARAGYLLG